MTAAASTPDLPTFHQELPKGHRSQSIFSSVHYFCNAGLMACKPISQKRNKTTVNAVNVYSVNSLQEFPIKLSSLQTVSMGEWEIAVLSIAAARLACGQQRERLMQVFTSANDKEPHCQQYGYAYVLLLPFLYCRNSQWPAHQHCTVFICSTLGKFLQKFDTRTECILHTDSTRL